MPNSTHGVSASMNSSTKVSGSKSLSMRSRAVSLPSACCLAAAFGSASRALCSNAASFFSSSSLDFAIVQRLAADDAHAFEHRQHDRRGDDRTDLAGGVGAHRVHEQITLLVVLLSFDL